MAEHDMAIDNQVGSAFRTDLNNALLALVTLSSKATAPTTKFTYMLWADTGTGHLRMWDGAGWIDLGTLATNMGHLTAGTAASITAQHTFAYAGAPFIINNNTKVANLNADLLDGKEIADIQSGSLVYAEDGGGDDAYSITLSPAPAGYTTGMVVNFKAGMANAGPCSLDVNSLGIKAIKKAVTSDLATGDILLNQRVSVIYDGTNFQMLSAAAGGGFNPVFTLPTVDDTVSSNSPTTTAFNAGSGGVTAFDVVGLQSGVWRKVVGGSNLYEHTMLGVALATASSGFSVNVALPGSYIRHDAWNWTIAATGSLGTLIYANSLGVTQTPSSGNTYRIIGAPISADVMFFNPEGIFVKP